MIPAVGFLTDHQIAILVASILCEQSGLPVPSVPLLLLTGSLAGVDPARLAPSICAAVLTCLASDAIWFQVGRWRGSRNRPQVDASPNATFGLGRLAELVHQYQFLALVSARFLPIPNLAAAFAGSSRMSRVKFITFDAIASAMWAGGYIAVGYIYRDQLEGIVHAASELPSSYVFLLASTVAAIALGVRLGRQNSQSCPA